MRLLNIDIAALQKSTRVQINAQMFQKANHKGMALLVHALLTAFDGEESTIAAFSHCWFPYSMVEMREFKLVVEKVVQDLVNRGKLQATDLTRATLESAAGVRMW